jgi:hypothetical protein
MACGPTIAITTTRSRGGSHKRPPQNGITHARALEAAIHADTRARSEQGPPHICRSGLDRARLVPLPCRGSVRVSVRGVITLMGCTPSPRHFRNPQTGLARKGNPARRMAGPGSLLRFGYRFCPGMRFVLNSRASSASPPGTLRTSAVLARSCRCSCRSPACTVQAAVHQPLTTLR